MPLQGQEDIKPAVPPAQLYGERLAVVQEDQGKHKEAWITWREVIERENDKGTLVRYAQFLKRIDESDEAILVMQRVIKDYPPRNPSLLYWIADAHAEEDAFKAARLQLEQIKKDFPQEAAEIDRRLAHLDRMEAKTKGVTEAKAVKAENEARYQKKKSKK